MDKKKIIIIVLAILCICGIGFYVMNNNKASETVPKEDTVTEKPEEKKEEVEEEPNQKEETVEIKEDDLDGYESVDINDEYEGIVVPAED